MKKIARAFFSLVIASVTVCMVFSFDAVKVNAAQDNNDGGDGYVGGLVEGSVHPNIYMYKVTVYSDPSNTATKQSDISNFSVKVTKYFRNSKGGSTGIAGSKNKFEYIKNPNSMSAVNLNQNLVVTDNNVPYVYIGNKADISTCKKDISEYFTKNNFQIVQRIAPNVGKDDSWVLIVEPVIRSYVNNQVYLYTPTEYAVAMKCKGTHAIDSYNYKLGSLTLGVPAKISSMADGTWLGAGSKSYYKGWENVSYVATEANRTAWMNYVNDYIRYAGVFMWFSQAFENSDFTPKAVPANTDKFEEEEITISTQITRTNPGKAGTVNATLKLNSSGFSGAQIISSATQSISFAKGEVSKPVSWRVKVGSYGDKSTNRSYTYDINVSPAEGTKDLNMNNNTVSGKITLKRDLQVTDISLDKSECFENSNVTVRFSVKNANKHKAYSSVPVAVYFTYGGKTTKISETTLSFDKDETKSGSCTLNVGCVTANSDQTDTITVVLNSSNVSAESGSKYSEPVMTNNKATKTVKVKRDINLSVSIVDRSTWESYIGNAPSKVADAGKTQAVTTCAVTNNSRFNLYESDPMKDKITVNFYVNNKLVGSKSVPVPRYGSNLVWFKWDVPDGSSVTLRAELKWNVDQENSPSPYADNTASINKSIKTVNKLSTPDTKLMMEHGSNKNYSKASAYTRFKPSVAKWSQWICNSGGTFTRIDYAMTGDSVLTLTPMKSASYYDGSTIASGSAFSAVFSYTVRTECSEAGRDVSADDYTYAQNVVAMFPEFQYTNSGDCRTMYLVKEDGNLKNASFQFEKNPYIEDKQRVHFTPSNMPDGEYKVGVVASSMWTPAGPIYVNAASSVMINGSVYDDWSPNASVK